MLDEIASRIEQINRWNRNKKPNKIKLVENINKDTQNFLGMSLMQKQAPP